MATRTTARPRKTVAKRKAPAPARRRGARPACTKAELDRDTPGLYAYCLKHRPRFRTDFAKLVARPRWRTPAPSTKARAAGAYFDVNEVDRFLRFCATLRHIKGRQFAGRPFIPDLWQVVFIIAPLFGWRRADGTRLYRMLYLEVPRKNGKSTLCAAIALYLLVADREAGAEVVSAARDREQARAVFGVASNMAKRSPALRKRLHIADRMGRIEYTQTASTYKVVSSDRGGLSKHGLNLHGAVVDELHVIADRELITTLETGTGSRVQPLICYITTAGIPTESPVWADKRDLCIKVSDGVIEDPELLGIIFAAPAEAAVDGSWRDPAVWAGCNPGNGITVRTDYLATRAARAEVSPADLSGFLRLHLNIPTESVTGWVPLNIWDRSASLVDEADLVGARCYGGLDLASSLDLAALILVFPDEDDDYVDVMARFWTPADTIRARSHADRADYERWAADGFLTATPGETINYDAIEEEIVATLDHFDVRSLDYDPWGSKQLRQHLEDAGAPVVECRQGFATLSPPMKEAGTLVYNRRLRHGGHPVLRFCVGNTLAALDPAGNIKPDRKRSRGRIDGTVGLVMAVGGWLRDLEIGESDYEDYDLEVV
jgi:phage terminase large subunit-like protein